MLSFMTPDDLPDGDDRFDRLASIERLPGEHQGSKESSERET
jgi:hypothetical protein